jgi:hypothetical protein
MPPGNDATGNPFKTFKAALARANGNLLAGTPTKIVLNPGTYREGDLDTGTDPDFLVIEGKGKRDGDPLRLRRSAA